LASTYTISDGTGRVLIPQDNTNTLDGCQVISDSALDSTIILKLQQSSDGLTFHDLPEDPINADAGANSNLLQTASFVLDELYVYIDVQSATSGTLNLFSFGK
jgi:hypothetical protein